MSTKINLTYCGMDGQGATVKEAKLDATRKIERFIKDTESGPYFQETEGYVIAVYLSYASWSYRILGPAFGHCECMGAPSKTEAIRRAKKHLAQTLSTVDNVRTDLCDFEDQAELISYFKWQLRWKEFKAQGFNDNDCHKLASGWTVEQVV